MKKIIIEENEQHEVKTPNFEGEKMKLPENHDSVPDQVEKNGVITGPLLTILALLLILVFGGLYYWSTTFTTPESPPAPTVERPTAEENDEPESTTAEAQTEMIEAALSSSDEISAIEADLEATDLISMEAEMNALEAELDTALNEM